MAPLNAVQCRLDLFGQSADMQRNSQKDLQIDQEDDCQKWGAVPYYAVSLKAVTSKEDGKDGFC
ncbi:MAG: hypothetical protein WBD20_19585 [Pirellulaceae bacterium]